MDAPGTPPFRRRSTPEACSRRGALARRARRAYDLSVVQPVNPETYADYLAAERNSELRHEYLRGSITAMAGGTPEHAALALAVGAELRAVLRGKPCRVYGPDLRIRIDPTDLSTYPDATVVCGPPQFSVMDPHAIVNPTLIVEVLSDSTEAYDRGQKFSHYRRLDSLKEFLLVSQREARLELFRRADDGSWRLTEAGQGESLTIDSLNVTLSTDDVYNAPHIPRNMA